MLIFIGRNLKNKKSCILRIIQFDCDICGSIFDIVIVKFSKFHPGIFSGKYVWFTR